MICRHILNTNNTGTKMLNKESTIGCLIDSLVLLASKALSYQQICETHVKPQMRLGLA
jgi:hypothetical protein